MSLKWTADSRKYLSVKLNAEPKYYVWTEHTLWRDQSKDTDFLIGVSRLTWRLRLLLFFFFFFLQSMVLAMRICLLRLWGIMIINHSFGFIWTKPLRNTSGRLNLVLSVSQLFVCISWGLASLRNRIGGLCFRPESTDYRCHWFCWYWINEQLRQMAPLMRDVVNVC